MAETVAFHRSKYADVPLDERIDSVPEVREVFSLEPADEVGSLEMRCLSTLGGRTYGSLREYVGRYTIDELRWELLSSGVEDVPRGPKAALVDLYMEAFMPQTLDEFMSCALPYGPDCVRELRKLIGMGGKRYVAKYAGPNPFLQQFLMFKGVPGADAQEANADGELPMAAFPNILLFDAIYCFAEVVPDEALTLYGTFTDEQWEDFERKAAVCADAIRYFSRVADLRGVVSLSEVIDEWRVAHGEEVDDLVMSVLEDSYLWRRQVHLRAERLDGTDYLVFDPLARRSEEERLLHKRDLLKECVSSHEEHDPHPVDAHLMEAMGVGVELLLAPEGRSLIELLDDHVPDGSKDDTFAIAVTTNLIGKLRLRDDAVACVDKELDYEGVRPVGDLAARIHEAAERLNRIVPKWRLNGWTLAEDDERAGRVFDMPETETDASDEPSGYVSPDEGKKADVRATPARKEPSAAIFEDEPEEEAEDRPQEEDGAEGTPGKDAGEELTERYEKENETYLAEFEQWLLDSGLKEKTIKRHLSNADLYINDYLAYREQMPMHKGVRETESFFSWFYIRKCLWSTPSNLRTTAASLKKFYKCMFKLGYIDGEDLDELLEDIKYGLDGWCEECADYNGSLY